MKKLVFYRCKHCGNISVKLVDKKVPMMCCGEFMEELTANTVDASAEKHVPVVQIMDNLVSVSVGSALHPMTEDHYIQFIVLETNKGFYVHGLMPDDEPKTTFALTADEKATSVYEYCNLHGLWKL